VVAIGPPIGALVFEIYIKTDWGISLFFLVPLALVAIPALRLPRMALFNITVIWLVATLATLAASPTDAARGADAVVVGTEWPMFRDVSADELVAAGRPIVLDASRFLATTLGADQRLRYVAVGTPGL
jgi:hypothetical protein